MKKYVVFAAILSLLFAGCGGGGGSDTPKVCHVTIDSSVTEQNFQNAITDTDCNLDITVKDGGNILGYAVSTPNNPNLTIVAELDNKGCSLDIAGDGSFSSPECEIYMADSYSGTCGYLYKNEAKDIACD